MVEPFDLQALAQGFAGAMHHGVVVGGADAAMALDVGRVPAHDFAQHEYAGGVFGQAVEAGLEHVLELAVFQILLGAALVDGDAVGIPMPAAVKLGFVEFVQLHFGGGFGEHAAVALLVAQVVVDFCFSKWRTARF